jgi:drug/metabolite transporter (DMT)-like permease
MSGTPQKTMGGAEWGMMAILSLLWGGSFIFVELALETFPPFSLVFLRVLIGALTLTLILKIQGVKLPRDTQSWKTFLVMALLQNIIPFSLIVWGQQYITAGLASIFNATTPFFTILVMQLFTADEKITPLKLMGLISGFIGVVLITGPEALDGLSNAGLGKFAVLGAAFCYGLSVLWARKFNASAGGIAPCGMLWCSSAVMLVLTFIDGRPFMGTPTLSSIGAIIAIGVLSSAVAYLLFFAILKRAGGTNASLVTFIIPFSAIFLAFIFLGETLSAQTLPGAVMIFMGLMLVDGRVFKRFLAPKKQA